MLKKGDEIADVNNLIRVLGDGKDNSQNASKVESVLEMEVGNTQEPTRDLIRWAIVDKNIPIGSTTNGYFLIDNDLELQEVIESLESRIDGLRKRIEGLKKGWHKREKSR